MGRSSRISHGAHVRTLVWPVGVRTCAPLNNIRMLLIHLSSLLYMLCGLAGIVFEHKRLPRARKAAPHAACPPPPPPWRSSSIVVLSWHRQPLSVTTVVHTNTTIPRTGVGNMFDAFRPSRQNHQYIHEERGRKGKRIVRRKLSALLAVDPLRFTKPRYGITTQTERK